MPEEIKRAAARRSRIHGTGLFATEDIPKGEKIIEYTGEKITKNEAYRRYEEQSAQGAIYLFDLNKRYDIDGARHGNDARFANHSCDPNAETIIERGRIWIVAKKRIEKGAEIVYDYNFPYFDHDKRPCRCGSDNCRGWIMSKRALYYKRQKEAKQAAKRTGKVVKKTAKPARTAKKGPDPAKKPAKATKKGTKATKPAKQARAGSGGRAGAASRHGVAERHASATRGGRPVGKKAAPKRAKQ